VHPQDQLGHHDAWYLEGRAWATVARRLCTITGFYRYAEAPELAVRCAEVLARLMAELADVTVAPPLPNP
jgi:hypothetical protein